MVQVLGPPQMPGWRLPLLWLLLLNPFHNHGVVGRLAVGRGLHQVEILQYQQSPYLARCCVAHL